MIPFVNAVWAIYRKDLAVWQHNPGILIATIISPLLFFLLLTVEVGAVGLSPVALVTLDTGASGIQMQQICQHRTSPGTAQPSGRGRCNNDSCRLHGAVSGA
jgi:hypothetical protein